MKIFFRLLLLAITLATCTTSLAQSTSSCRYPLKIKSENGKPLCLSDYQFSQESITYGKTVADVVLASKCYALALSNEPSCKAIGVSTISQSHCNNAFFDVPREQDAYSQCVNKGCPCSVVISSVAQIVNSSVINAWEENLSAPIATITSEKNTTPPKRISTPIAQEESRSEIKTERVEAPLRANISQPDEDGLVTINIQTRGDTESISINGEAQDTLQDGKYSFGTYKYQRHIKMGQVASFHVVVKSLDGRVETKTLTASRKIAQEKETVSELTPTAIKKSSPRDAVAIIIGITDYKNLPRAEFANDDAASFYDYAVRGLGIRPENIKLLIDKEAEQIEIYRAFKTWLPSKIKSTTELYVFYSGHGLPTEDGKSIYFLPLKVDKDFLAETAINQAQIVSAIQSTNPKSVTFFLDSCYSGLARGGQTLIASARPVTLQSKQLLFPPNFTVFSASRHDQISSSSPELKHGIFSYYLMKGMEGDADANKDGKITFGEMQKYLSEQVPRQAGMVNRQQTPVIVGDADKVLISR